MSSRLYDDQLRSDLLIPMDQSQAQAHRSRKRRKIRSIGTIIYLSTKKGAIDIKEV